MNVDQTPIVMVVVVLVVFNQQKSQITFITVYCLSQILIFITTMKLCSHRHAIRFKALKYINYCMTKVLRIL